MEEYQVTIAGPITAPQLENEEYERFAKYFANDIGDALKQAQQDLEPDERIVEISELGH